MLSGERTAARDGSLCFCDIGPRYFLDDSWQIGELGLFEFIGELNLFDAKFINSAING